MRNQSRFRMHKLLPTTVTLEIAIALAAIMGSRKA
jgi:hypothetical protein